ncbi:MAG: hypothetical protein RBU23_09500 [Candidatus Auribacterota bacterium]|jgi:hypothetical protein|nr:hypothetical protein [Candidatus Auribacterota bacterium]
MNAESVFVANISGFKANCLRLGASSDSNIPYIADVVLPKNTRGKILAGKKAEDSRVASGYPWPEEARIEKERLRRVPVPLLWKMLLTKQRQDKMQLEWHMTDSVSFSFSRMLATYIHGILPKDYFDNKTKRLFLAIPDAMNEYSQDNLIRELKMLSVESYQKRSVDFVWRPIALALAWLDKINLTIINSYKENDFIVICYIGVDAIEIVDYSLTRKSNFIIPKRHASGDTLPVAGIDWVSDYISELQGRHNFYAFWQYFTNIPEIWNSFAGINNTKESLPDVWYDGVEWRNFVPTDINEQTALNMECKQNKVIQEISHNLKDSMIKLHSTWEDFIIEKILSAIMEKKNKRLRGVIVNGDIFSFSTAQLMKKLLTQLAKISDIKDISEEPNEDTLWCPKPLRDVVSEGISVYADRIISKLPTYIDVLKGLHIFVDKKTEYGWHELVEDGYEIDGGQKKDDIRSGYIFQLKPKSNRLSVYLKRGPNDIKKQEVFFPESPIKEMPIEARICVAPAHGLATVEMVPKDPTFLGGQKVFLDYSMMTSINQNDLPQKKLGTPGVDEDFLLSQNDVLLFRIATEINNFIDTNLSIEFGIYELSVSDLKSRFMRVSKRNGKKVYLFNRLGYASTDKGNKLLKKIKDKIRNDFALLLQDRTLFDWKTKIQLLVGLSSWMFGGCVDVIVEFIKMQMRKTSRIIPQHILIHAAGRSFSNDDDIKLLYKSLFDLINERIKIKKEPIFPNYVMQALSKTLSLRENAPNCMTSFQVNTFMHHTVLVINKNANHRYAKSSLFVQAVNTFLYLLRFREIDPTFFNEDDPLKKTVKDAINTAKNIRHFSSRLKEICFCIDKVIDCQATKDDLIMLKQNIDEEIGDDEN